MQTKWTDSHFPALVTMHFNELDGLMCVRSNRPVGRQYWTLLYQCVAYHTSNGLPPVLTPVFPHFSIKCLCFNWLFFICEPLTLTETSRTLA